MSRLNDNRKADHPNNEPLISPRKFKRIDEKVERGSSPVRNWYRDENGRKWMGKCSMATYMAGAFDGKHAHSQSNFDDYKELLAIKLYSLFKVKTPETTLSLQCLGSDIQQNNFLDAEHVDRPRIHLMSRYLDGFEELGDDFVEKYTSSIANGTLAYYPQENLPLKGFGRALFASILLHDYDCLGNSGGNMGYIVNKEEEVAEVVKIDPGEALSFAYDMTSANVDNHPSKKEARIGTTIRPLPYSYLRQNDREEFIQTAKEILELPDEKIVEVFQEFLPLDDRFDIILKSLLYRKRELLSAFASELQGVQSNDQKAGIIDFLRRFQAKFSRKTAQVLQDTSALSYYKNLGSIFHVKLPLEGTFSFKSRKSHFNLERFSGPLYDSRIELGDSLWRLFIRPLSEFIIPADNGSYKQSFARECIPSETGLENLNPFSYFTKNARNKQMRDLGSLDYSKGVDKLLKISRLRWEFRADL